MTKALYDHPILPVADDDTDGAESEQPPDHVPEGAGWNIAADCPWPKDLTQALQQTAPKIWQYFAQHYPNFPAYACAELQLSDDFTVQKLNARWRGKDTPTNVLSFPALPKETAVAWPTQHFPLPLALGTIIIALETLQNEAGALGLPTEEHAIHLIIHGLLHLLHHDHVKHEERQEMERWEILALNTLGYDSPYSAT